MIFMYVLINTVMVVNAVNQVQACCLKQQKKHGLNLTQCAVVGDRWTDIVAGAKSKCDYDSSPNRRWV